MNWERRRVFDVCELAYGKSLTADSRMPGDYPVYGSAGEVGMHNNYLIEGPGIIIGRKGSVGTVYYEKRNFYPIDTSYYVIVKPENDLRFLYYKLQTLGLNRLNSDAAVPGLNRNVAYEQSSNFPPLPTQRKIAAILSVYDDLIENNLKRIRLLEKKAQLHYKTLMQEMICSKVKREKYIKDCLDFYIGGGWGEEEYKDGFSELAFVIRGTDIPDARKGNISGVPLRYHKETNLASRKLKAGDIVFEISGGSKGQPVGRSLLVNKKLLKQFDQPVMCASFCKLLRPDENVSPEFFFLFLLSCRENGIITQYEKHSASNIVNYF